MSEPKKMTFEEAVQALYGHPSFDVICTKMVEDREHAITKLATYKDDTELKKAAAEITVVTEWLNDFGVATGEVRT